MLVLSRLRGERIVLIDERNGDIIATVTAVDPSRSRLGFEAPPHIKVLRDELVRDYYERTQDEG